MALNRWWDWSTVTLLEYPQLTVRDMREFIRNKNNDELLLVVDDSGKIVPVVKLVVGAGARGVIIRSENYYRNPNRP
jgi:hypothetical protein